MTVVDLTPAETVPVRVTPDDLVFALRMAGPDIAAHVCARYPRP
jgi:hypothetical protein